MNKTFRLLILSFTILGSNLVFAQSHIDVETLIQTEKSWDGTSYASYPSGPPEITVQKIVIPPNTVLPWHKHSMPIAGVVESGQLTVEKTNGEKVTFSKGQVIAETVNSVHRGSAGDAAVTLIVFYAGKHGLPLSEHN